MSVWYKELRAPFTTLSFSFGVMSVLLAYSRGYINLAIGIACIAGLVALHASVNVLNDYFDFKSGIDVVTAPTPFSGGSRVLPDGLMTPNQVLAEGAILLLIGLGLGGFVIYSSGYSLTLIALLLFGFMCVVGYSSFFSHIGLGELITGLGFGPMYSLGVYYALVGSLSWEPVLIGVTTGTLTSAVLYVNEFPDFEADRIKGRMHLVARWGKRKAAKYFKFFFFIAYTSLAVAILLQIAPFTVAIGFLTLPSAFKASNILESNYAVVKDHLMSNAFTIKTAVNTGFLIAAGYIISMAIKLALNI